MWKKKTQSAFFASGDGEKKETSDSVLYLKYFIRALKLLRRTKNYCGSLIFHHPPVSP